MSGLEVVAFVLGVLAVIGFAAAWQTMHWLGDAEDLIEKCKEVLEHRAIFTFGRELEHWKRRTPRRTV